MHSASRPRFVSNLSYAADADDIGEMRTWAEEARRNRARSIGINSRSFISRILFSHRVRVPPGVTVIIPSHSAQRVYPHFIVRVALLRRRGTNLIDTRVRTAQRDPQHKQPRPKIVSPRRFTRGVNRRRINMLGDKTRRQRRDQRNQNEGGKETRI